MSGSGAPGVKKTILGLFYYDPADERLFVPKVHGIGVTMNFGHPRALRILPFFLISISLPVMLVVAARMFETAPVFHFSSIVAWPGLSLFALSAIVYFSSRGLSAAADPVLCGWGGAVFVVAIAIQRLAVLPYIHFRGGRAALGAADMLALGFIAGAVQETTRYILMRFIHGRKPSGEVSTATLALSFGAGFSAVEILTLAIMGLASSPAGGLGAAEVALGVAERFSASLLHIAFSMTIAAGIVAGSPGKALAAAILLHGLVDLSAGLMSGGMLGISPAAYEVALMAFSACAFALASRMRFLSEKSAA